MKRLGTNLSVGIDLSDVLKYKGLTYQFIFINLSDIKIHKSYLRVDYIKKKVTFTEKGGGEVALGHNRGISAEKEAKVGEGEEAESNPSPRPSLLIYDHY